MERFPEEAGPEKGARKAGPGRSGAELEKAEGLSEEAGSWRGGGAEPAEGRWRGARNLWGSLVEVGPEEEAGREVAEA